VGAIVKLAVGDYVVKWFTLAEWGFEPLILGILVKVKFMAPITFDHGLL
jgi:hypothetical protein